MAANTPCNTTTARDAINDARALLAVLSSANENDDSLDGFGEFLLIKHVQSLLSFAQTALEPALSAPQND